MEVKQKPKTFSKGQGRGQAIPLLPIKISRFEFRIWGSLSDKCQKKIIRLSNLAI